MAQYRAPTAASVIATTASPIRPRKVRSRAWCPRRTPPRRPARGSGNQTNSQPERAAADHRRIGQVEVDPPQAQRHQETQTTDDPALDGELESRHARDHADDGFAEDDDEERAEALGQVRDHDGPPLERPPCSNRDREVDQHRRAPEHVAKSAGYEDRQQPEPGRARVTGEVDVSQPVTLTVDVVTSASVQRRAATHEGPRIRQRTQPLRRRLPSPGGDRPRPPQSPPSHPTS